MNLLDLTIVLAVLLFAVQGFRNGLVREVFTIGGVILGLFVTFRFLEPSTELLLSWFDQRREILLFASGLLLFTLTFVFVLSISVLIRRFLEFLRLNLINRLAGLFFGGLKSSLVISAVLLLLAGVNLPGEETREGSFVYPYILPMAPAVYTWMTHLIPGSDDVMDRMQERFEENAFTHPESIPTEERTKSRL